MTLRLQFVAKLDFGNVSFEERRNPEYPGKTLKAKMERINNKLNRHMALTPRFDPGPHSWEASALITVPSLAPLDLA